MVEGYDTKRYDYDISGSEWGIVVGWVYDTDVMRALIFRWMEGIFSMIVEDGSSFFGVGD